MSDYQNPPNKRPGPLGRGVGGSIDFYDILQRQKQNGITTTDLDSLPWLSHDQWKETEWDCTEKGDPCWDCNKMRTWLFPSSTNPGNGEMRGLRQLYYTVKPFLDPTNPTPGEFENWNILVINHFRNLFGKTNPAVLSKENTLAAQWANERQMTDGWDAKYPTGICTSTSGPHCGFGFWLSGGWTLDPVTKKWNSSDQQPYLTGPTLPILDRQFHFYGPYFSTDGGWETGKSIKPPVAFGASAEGIASAKIDENLALLMSHVIRSWICDGGHVGPLWGRKLLGISYVSHGNAISIRIQSSGDLTPLCP
jgi:hypothetical protein